MAKNDRILLDGIIDDRVSTEGQFDARSGIWTSKLKIVVLCQLLERDFGVTGLRALENHIFLDKLIPQKSDQLPPTEDLISRVKALLPPQPWKPGIHRSISSHLAAVRRRTLRQ